MKIQRLRFTAWVMGFALLFGVSSIAGAVRASATGGSAPRSAAAAKAKHKKKTPTRAQKLAKALKACKQDKSAAKRKACERAAKKKYGAKAPKTKVVTKVETREVPGPTKVETKEVAGPTKVETKVETKEVTGPTKVETKEVPGPTMVETKVVEVEKVTPPPPEPPALGEGAKEKGGTKAINAASEIPTAPEFTPQQLNNEPSGNWISPLGGSTGDHYSQLNEITSSNVHELKAAWMTQLDGSAMVIPDTGEADPTEYEGVLYEPTGTDDLFALSVATGKILWVHESELPETVADVCCGWDNRGVAIGGGLVYSALLNGSIEALNQQTGKLVWRTEFAQPSAGLTVTASPLYYEGMVFIGPVGSEYGVRGFMAAFNAKTGEEIWKHYNIPGPGEYGSNSWPHGTPCNQCNAEWQHGGATVWNAPTVDPKDGLIYYATANAGDDTDGIDREGANLWSASMIALNYKTGQLAWGYQNVHHDVWDFDNTIPTTMINVKVGGKTVEAVVVANKDGWVYYLNAETGEPIFPITEEAVPTNAAADASYPSQPIPKMPPFIRQQATPEELAMQQEAVKKSAEANHVTAPTVTNGGWHEQDVFTPWALDTESVVSPGLFAGSGDREAPASYDPSTGDYYVCGVQGWMFLTTLTGGNGEPIEGKGYQNAPHSLISGRETPPNPPGTMTAYNMATGEIAWQDKWKEQCYSGALTTAGGVLFTGQDNGEFQAYNASTGELLWSFQTGASVNAPASTFEWNGKQYVAIYAAGNSHGPGQAGATDVLGDNLWLFTLNGSGPGPIEFGKTPAAPELLPERKERGR